MPTVNDVIGKLKDEHIATVEVKMDDTGAFGERGGFVIVVYIPMAQMQATVGPPWEPSARRDRPA